VVPGGLYRGNDGPTPSFDVRAILVTTAATPDDVVYLVVKSVFENFEESTRLDARHFADQPAHRPEVWLDAAEPPNGLRRSAERSTGHHEGLELVEVAPGVEVTSLAHMAFRPRRSIAGSTP
jgi:NMT1-like family